MSRMVPGALPTFELDHPLCAGLYPLPDPGVLRAAAVTVCANARDRAEAVELLAMLGLTVDAPAFWYWRLRRDAAWARRRAGL